MIKMIALFFGSIISDYKRVKKKIDSSKDVENIDHL